MQFELTQRQRELQQQVNFFAVHKVLPGAAERDENEVFDRELYDGLGALGITRLCYRMPPDADNGLIDFIIAAEAVAKADDSLAAALSASVLLCQWPIYRYGSESQKKGYLRLLNEGWQLGAFALTEPNAGSDVAAIETTAERQGDGYVLNGRKIFVTNGGEAETYIVFAKTNPSLRTKGMSAFILSRGMAGFTFGKREKKMGLRGCVTRELIFEDVLVPTSRLLGDEGQGFEIAMATLDGGRIGVAAQAVGIGQAALDYALDYAKQRTQFGKPISKQQGLAFILAAMETKLQAARLLTYQAALIRDAGQACTRQAAMAKLFASDAAMAITTDAVQIFGGYGFTRDYPVERLMRNAKITQIYEGTNQIQSMVIAGAMLR